MTYSKSLDWLTFSFNGNVELLPFDLGEFSLHTSRIPHYTQTIQTKRGITVHLSTNETQGHLCQVSGEGMRHLRKFGYYDHETVGNVLAMCKNITRLDYAIDYIGDNARVGDFAELIHSENVKNMGSKKVTEIETTRNGKGHTIYVGSRTSEFFLRAYDKASESKILNITWVRLEMELKKKLAKKGAHEVSESRQLNPLDSIMLNRFDPRGTHEWIDEAWNEAELPIEPPNLSADSNYSRYLSQVYKSITKRLDSGQNLEEIAIFKRLIEQLQIEQN